MLKEAHRPIELLHIISVAYVTVFFWHAHVPPNPALPIIIITLSCSELLDLSSKVF